MDAVFQCQSCKGPLCVGGIDAIADSMAGSSSRTMLASPDRSVNPASRIDESFVVLEDGSSRKGSAVPGVTRSLDESFVLLKGQTPQGGSQPAGAAGGIQLDAQLETLTRVFELASQEGEVDHPLCMECSEELRQELDMQVAEAESEVVAYEDALQKLQSETFSPLSQADFEEELRQLRETEACERKRSEQLAEVLKEAEAEARQLEGASAELDALEERYWHDFNDFKGQLRAHVEERDALLCKIDHAANELERLRCTNVYNDAFHIWYDGPFGTISGFRLGRTPAQPVEWTELNAAWGQATLLLHTMSQACGLHFSSYRLLPMGSHPRIADKKGTYDLFGPPKLWSGTYDKGMVCFVACLQEFADFATSYDRARTREPPFELHYPIDGDKVGGMTVKLTFNKDARWTKALKYMLTDLKLCLKWMIEVQECGELPGSSHQPSVTGV